MEIFKYYKNQYENLKIDKLSFEFRIHSLTNDVIKEIKKEHTRLLGLIEKRKILKKRY